jgi:hypothetical protein
MRRIKVCRSCDYKTKGVNSSPYKPNIIKIRQARHHPHSIWSKLHFLLEKLKHRNQCSKSSIKNSSIPLLPNVPGGIHENSRDATLDSFCQVDQRWIPPDLHQYIHDRNLNNPSNHLTTKSQTSLVKTQWRHRWASVSIARSQRGQIGLQGQFFCKSMSAVWILYWINNQANKWCFPSACAFQIALALKVVKDPMICIFYADLAE